MNVMSPRCIYRFDGKALYKIYQNNLLTSPYLIQPFEISYVFPPRDRFMKVREVQKGPLKGIPQGLSVGSNKLDPLRSTKTTNPNHRLTIRYDDYFFFKNTSPVLLPTENIDQPEIQLQIHLCVHI